MDTNEMEIIVSRAVLIGIQDAVINVLLTSQALVARDCRSRSQQPLKTAGVENSLHSFHYSIGDTKYSKECCAYLNVCHFYPQIVNSYM